MLSRHLLALAVLAAATHPAHAQPAGADSSVALTVYSSAQPGAIPAEWYRPLPGQAPPPASSLPGFAMVRVDRPLELQAGRSQLSFTGVAALLDPTTVRFESLTDPAGTRVLEQDFRFDLVSVSQLLARYVDGQVRVEGGQGDDVRQLEGTLLSAHDGLVLRDAQGEVHALRRWGALGFGEPAGGLVTRPTLEWQLSAKRGGRHDTRVSYQTGGITWWADYNLLFTPGRDANSGTVDLGAWVSLLNQSGVDYPEAKLKLVAGEVNRAQPRAVPVRAEMRVMTMEADAGFEEKAFFEYHLYTLGRPVTIANNSTKQVELLEGARRVPARKQLLFDGTTGYAWRGAPMVERDFRPGGEPKVEVWLQFQNDEKSGLGMPLPAGRVRVSQLDPADGGLEFIGEDTLGHTPRNERVRLRLGNAFDVVGERRQVDFSVDTRARVAEEDIEVTVRNRKREAVEVTVRESLYRTAGWRLLSHSLPYEKLDAGTIEFSARVAADAEQVIRYRVRYTW
ncbi:MAG: DUF4139 domain-containing protein [Steroidobacteraceae bacterium]|jgi:hypothetical protein